jgi:hypothetical protein
MSQGLAILQVLVRSWFQCFAHIYMNGGVETPQRLVHQHGHAQGFRDM